MKLIDQCLSSLLLMPALSSSVVKTKSFWYWRNVNQLFCENREEQFIKRLEGNSKSVKTTAVSSIKSSEHCCFTVGRGSRTALRGTVCVCVCVSGCQRGTSPSNFKTVICHLITNIQPTGSVREAL